MSTEQPQIFFGGPDLKKNLLRDVLLDQIKSSTPGSKIIWVCYYLNDPKIIETLNYAANNDIYVEVIIDADARCTDINHNFLKLIESTSKIHITQIKLKKFWQYLGIRWNPHLHSKLYYFSSPQPKIMIGSYNPTAGSEHLNYQQLSEIGDHSISHNVLTSIPDTMVIEKFLTYITQLKSPILRKLSRFSQLHNDTHRFNQWSINFLPTVSQHPIDRLLSENDENATIKCAISHLKGPGILHSLKQAIKKGKKIEVVLENSQRRVSKRHMLFLDKHHIDYHQPKSSEHCLMHNKFIIYKSDREHRVMFGSFNWSTRSRYLNHEIIACTDNSNFVDNFENRWQTLISYSDA